MLHAKVRFVNTSTTTTTLMRARVDDGWCPTLQMTTSMNIYFDTWDVRIGQSTLIYIYIYICKFKPNGTATSMPTKSACWMLAGPAYILCLPLFGSVHYFIVLERERYFQVPFRLRWMRARGEIGPRHGSWMGGTYVNDMHPSE